MDDLDVYVVIGSDPERVGGKPKVLEVFADQEQADAYLVRGLMIAYQNHGGTLEPGGQMSLLINRGREPAEGDPSPPGTTGSFIVNNEGGDRHAWDYVIQRARASAIPVKL
jgi:hypothetical protein